MVSAISLHTNDSQFANCELGLGGGLGLQCEGEQGAGERGGGLAEFVDATPV